MGMAFGLGGAIALLVGCGPTVGVDPPADEDEGSMDTGSGTTTTADATGPAPTTAGPTTTLPTTTVTTTTDKPLDLGSGELQIDGTYLLALAISVDPSVPLQFIAETKVFGGSMFLSLDPLTLSPGSTTEPREPLGQPLVYENIAVVDNCFTLKMGEVTLPGSANPITGSDIVAEIVLDGCFDSVGYCGTATGQVTVPLQLDIAGSTFGAIEADPGALPTDFPTSC